ncbi:hypothetical protein SCHPADRAFT_583075 [Schizopora paradoxa]|uniref:Uncharacterized protein n=1 Tax=Schizopora paradoxa TaxID=27342 RepID=A0A0H2RC35_9AGAM|nr:hypothetical protein SCHPADRAFT_583075 [Schizopora paradoxa]
MTITLADTKSIVHRAFRSTTRATSAALNFQISHLSILSSSHLAVTFDYSTGAWIRHVIRSRDKTKTWKEERRSAVRWMKEKIEGKKENKSSNHRLKKPDPLVQRPPRASNASERASRSTSSTERSQKSRFKSTLVLRMTLASSTRLFVTRSRHCGAISTRTHAQI